MEAISEEKCQLCGCEDDLTIHHLVPKLKCKNKYKDIRNEESNHITICRSCHDQIHALYSESELRDGYDTLEKLKTSEELMKFVNWKIKHPDFKGSSKMSNKRKRR